MSAIIILLVLSLFTAFGFLGFFIWSVSTRQYDDDFTPAMRILMDTELKQPTDTPTPPSIH